MSHLIILVDPVPYQVDVVGCSLGADCNETDPGQRSSPHNHSIVTRRGERWPPSLVFSLDSHLYCVVNWQIKGIFKKPNYGDFTIGRNYDIRVGSIAEVLLLELELIAVSAHEEYGIFCDEAVRFEDIFPVDDKLRPVRPFVKSRRIVRGDRRRAIHREIGGDWEGTRT